MKYGLTDVTIEHNGITLHRIKALKDIFTRHCLVKKGEIGGWVQSTYNLEQTDDSWIFQNAKVYNNAIIKDNSCITDYSEIYDYATTSKF